MRPGNIADYDWYVYDHPIRAVSCRVVSTMIDRHSHSQPAVMLTTSPSFKINQLLVHKKLLVSSAFREISHAVGVSVSAVSCFQRQELVSKHYVHSVSHSITYVPGIFQILFERFKKQVEDTSRGGLSSTSIVVFYVHRPVSKKNAAYVETDFFRDVSRPMLSVSC